MGEAKRRGSKEERVAKAISTRGETLVRELQEAAANRFKALQSMRSRGKSITDRLAVITKPGKTVPKMDIVVIDDVYTESLRRSKK